MIQSRKLDHAILYDEVYLTKTVNYFAVNYIADN